MKTFGHKRPVRDDRGNITGQKESPVRAITIDELGGAFGADKRRRLIVELAAGDVITFRPSGTTRKRTITLRAVDAYRFAIQCRANLANLEKARAKKARKAERLAAARLASAERRLTARAKRDCEG
jgi:hypothetical protein